MNKSDEEMALDAVIDDMGQAARAAKAKKYAPKPKPSEPVPVEAASDAPRVTAEQLESLLNAG